MRQLRSLIPQAACFFAGLAACYYRQDPSPWFAATITIGALRRPD